ncbi:MAG: GxxExxY protein [Cytophagaceae bacterium]|nr:MAG: GxxExxY protein [Cytophagaceae bacterium]
MQHSHLTEQIIAAAYTVHNTLGAGYLEKVYENAMLLELDKRGLQAVSQQPIPVFYELVIVGDFFADLLVEDCILVELKAAENLHPRHEAQLVNYLTSTGHDIGLLINFGTSVTIKRKHRTYRRTE